MEKIDVYTLGINTQLARKYNAIVNFINKDTVYEDGCINDRIVEVEYCREEVKNELFKTNDCIKITTGTFNKILCIDNPKSLSIDRKHNCIVRCCK